jgi:16S rRNA (cytosine1402-N4)-methyltransferase
MESIHKTVLLNETIEGLNLSPKSFVVDCTFGGGGHSAEICRRFPGVKIIALDADKSAFEKAKSKFKNLDCNISFINANFRELDMINSPAKDFGKYALGGVGQGTHFSQNPLRANNIDAIIFDLGLSSDQLENSGRGFSFMKNEPLIMTMKENPGSEDITAGEVVNTWSEKSLADIIYGYGEEKYSRRIAKGIVNARERTKIETTLDLVKIIRDAVPAIYRKGRLHFATKTFQAIRIAVNDELGVLKIGLTSGFTALKVGGRMAVISFHSLEDRIVKKFYKGFEKEGFARLVNKKPIRAGVEEQKSNVRSRSAKLRIIEKIK